MRFPSIRLLIPTLACTLSPPAAQAAAPRTRAMPTCSGDDNSGSDGSSDDFAAIRKVQGIGDTTLSAAWSFRDIGDTRLYVDLTGRVRLPTGDKSRGPGHGTTDYATLSEMGWDGDRGATTELAQSIRGRYLGKQAGISRMKAWRLS